jgi:N-acetyl-gamma-glutamyl-phosphate reductase
LKDALNISIVGASGYTGGELVERLLGHPHAKLVSLLGSEGAGGAKAEPRSFETLFPRLRGRVGISIVPLNPRELCDADVDVVFLATPHETSIELAPKLVDAGKRVIDLSGAWRLGTAAQTKATYGLHTERPECFQSAVYALVEINRGKLRDASLVSNPGCYPTASILALHPLVKAGAVRGGTRPIIDATSGVSGAGRTPNARTTFGEVSLQPYGVLNHRHAPEIELHTGTGVVFTPHLGAYDRGILATIHVELAPGWTAARIGELYREMYAHERFVRLLPPGEWPSVAGVRQTNFCDLNWAVDEKHGHLIVVSAIDNLVKGASGQAIQAMNAMHGMPEHLGLLDMGLLDGADARELSSKGSNGGGA